MRKLCGVLFALVFLTCLQASATGDSLSYLLASDTVVLELDYAGELVFEHRLEPKQTLFSLAKHYGMELAELYAYNPNMRVESLSVGDVVRIPIPSKAVDHLEPPYWLMNRYAPVFFRVRRGDTVYGICKRYFPGLEMDTLRNRNQLLTDGLSHGKVLFIGWISLYGVPKNMRTEMGPGGRQNYMNKLAYFHKKGNKRERQERGAAYWERKSSEDGGLFALHRYAKVGSYVEVHNPMSRVTLYLKVIGKMPASAHDPETVVVVSPRAAKLLNGLDRRFYVKVKYY